MLALTPRIVRESRAPGVGRNFDVVGASSVTAGLALLVYAISKAPIDGWSDVTTIVLLIAAAALIVFFVVVGGARREPAHAALDLPRSDARRRERRGLLLGASIFADFFLLTLYVQNVLGYSPMKTGVTFLATAGTWSSWAGLAAVA